MKRSDKLRFLSWQQKKVLLYAFLILNVIRFSLWLWPFGQLKKNLEKVLSIWVCDAKKVSVSVDFIVWTVLVAGRYAPGGAKCLARALTTQMLLNRYGYHHELCIGVAKGNSQTLEAHAWIEYQGRVLMGGLKNLNRFKPLPAARVVARVKV